MDLLLEPYHPPDSPPDKMANSTSASHFPARRISGQRLRSPSPRRRKLADTSSKTELGNFSKLFALLHSSSGFSGPHQAGAGPEALSATAAPSLPEAIADSSTATVPYQRDTRVEQPEAASSSPVEIMGNRKSKSSAWAKDRSIGRSRRSLNSSPASSTSVSPARNAKDSGDCRLASSAFKDCSSSQRSSPGLGSSPNRFAALDGDCHRLSSDSSLDSLLDSSAGEPFDNEDEAEEDKFFDSSQPTTPPTTSIEVTQTYKLGAELSAAVARLEPFSQRPQSPQSPRTKTDLLALRKDLVSAALPSEFAQRIFELDISSAKKTKILRPTFSFTDHITNAFQVHDDRVKGQFSKQLNNGVHVFIDWSNFMLGCLQAIRERRGILPNKNVKEKINFDRVKNLLERGRHVKTRELAGSWGTNFARRHLTEIANSSEYNTSILSRVQRTADCLGESTSESSDSSGPDFLSFSGMKEQCVDELLQLKMMETIWDCKFDTSDEFGDGDNDEAEYQSSTSPAGGSGVMVLATGDGNEAEFSKDGFLGKVTKALKSGWTVELYAFKNNMASVWRTKAFQDRWKGRFTAHILDEHVELLVARE